jgi:peptidoglycan/LPS O-acetylase OafA/YrhL
MAGILGLAAVCTLLLLPALVHLLSRRLFPRLTVTRITCNCAACVLASVAAVIVLALSFHSYSHLGWNRLTLLAVIAVPLLVLACGLISRRRECRMLAEQTGAAQKDEEE